MASDSSIRAFKCPTCGAPLEPQVGALTMKCSYCGGTVIIPKSLQTPAPGSSASVPQYHWGGLNLTEIVGSAMQLPEAISLAEQGRITEAAQLYSQITGTNLTDATTAINQIVAGQAVSLVPGQSGMTWGQTPSMYAGFNQPSYAPFTGSTFGTSSSSTPSQPRGFDFGYWIGSKLWIIIVLVVVCSLIAAFGTTLLGLIPFASFFGSSSSSSGSNNPIATVLSMATNLPAGLSGIASNGFANQTLSFGSKGIGQGMFTDARAVAVDGNGNIIVGDFQDGRIQIFDPTGKFVSMIPLGNKVGVDSLAASRDGKIYAVHQGKITVYDSTGKQLQQIQDDQRYYQSIALGPDGTLYAATDEDSIVHFNQNGKINLEIKKAFENVTGDGESEAKIAVDGLGNIYAVGSTNYLVFKFTPEGKYVNQFGGEADASNIQNGKFVEPSGIAIDGYGRIFVADIFGSVQVFDSSGAYLNSFPAEAYGITIGSDNNAYVALGDKVQKFQVQKPAGQ
jgi:DNA-directed RNA polymerase subunit RPC12/RpoP